VKALDMKTSISSNQFATRLYVEGHETKAKEDEEQGLESGLYHICKEIRTLGKDPLLLYI
jgi:hypothetical protein